MTREEYEAIRKEVLADKTTEPAARKLFEDDEWFEGFIVRGMEFEVEVQQMKYTPEQAMRTAYAIVMAHGGFKWQ